MNNLISFFVLASEEDHSSIGRYVECDCSHQAEHLLGWCEWQGQSYYFIVEV